MPPKGRWWPTSSASWVMLLAVCLFAWTVYEDSTYVSADIHIPWTFVIGALVFFAAYLYTKELKKGGD